MNKLLTFGLAATGLYLVWDFAKKTANNFTVDVVGYGKPALQGFALTIPLQLRFKNPTPVPVNLDRFYADIYVWKNNQYVRGAVINQMLSIPAGVSDQVVSPQVNLDSIFGGNAVQTANFISQLVATKSINLRIEYQITYGGVTFPKKIDTQNLAFT